MIRKLKILWLVLIAVLALGAVATTGVFAEEEEEGLPKRFETPEKFPTVVTGEKGSFTFTAEGDEVKCTSHYEGTIPEKWVTELTIVPTYTQCSAPGFTKADVNFEECHYTFTLEPGIDKKTTGNGETHTKGPFHIECPEGKEIRVTMTMFGFKICSVSIPEQTSTGPAVDTKNEDLGKTRFVLFTWTVKGLAYNIESGGGACGEEGGHLFGALDGAIKVLAFVDEEGKPGEQTAFRIAGN